MCYNISNEGLRRRFWDRIGRMRLFLGPFGMNL